jgi:hypothetical protein
MDMTDSWEAQRSAPRHNLITLAWFKRVDDAALESDEGIARSFDVSSTGAGLVTTISMPVGSRLLLQLVIPNGKVSAVARVMNVTPAGNGAFRLGLQVYAVPPTDLATWKRMVGE